MIDSRATDRALKAFAVIITGLANRRAKSINTAFPDLYCHFWGSSRVRLGVVLWVILGGRLGRVVWGSVRHILPASQNCRKHISRILDILLPCHVISLLQC